jgi:hypothetical protein
LDLKKIDFGTSKLKWADVEIKCYVLYLGKVIWDNKQTHLCGKHKYKLKIN